MSNPVLSILIPCYNSGAFLPEALESIKNYPDASFYEVIIVNDGSTDVATLSLMDDLRRQEYIVFDQENKGPAAARNFAAKKAKGKYLLLLDSDNKVRTNYIKNGVKVLDEMPDISIVHGRPYFFGDVNPSRLFEAGKFDLRKILAKNYIDTCAIIRKSAWEKLEGQDEMSFVEDWEFWIRAGLEGLKFFFLDEVCFDYRIISTSLTQNLVEKKWQQQRQYIYKKHIQLLIKEYDDLYIQNLIYKTDQEHPIRSFFKYFYNKYFKSNSR